VTRSIAKGGAVRGLCPVLAVLAFGCAPPPAGSGSPVPPPVVGRIEPDEDQPPPPPASFQLTDQTGKPFDSRSLAGKVWMGSIFFSTCPGPCFRENQAIAGIMADITDPDFVSVSLTCDPENDTPEVLGHYAARFAADPARWKFLTGDMAVITDVGKNLFRLPVALGVHAERGVVFDRRGRLRGGYHLLQDDAVARLKALIRDVLAEPVSGAEPAAPAAARSAP